jgi:hypothetical protein
MAPTPEAPAPARRATGHGCTAPGGARNDGAPNTGNGGATQRSQYYPNSNGGSGIVIIRYAGAQLAGGGNYSNPAPGATSIHTFTGDGTFRSNAAAVYVIN